MILAEYKEDGFVVRIHDECINKAPDHYLSELGRIMTNSYKRRRLEQGPNIAAMQSDGNCSQELL